MGSALFFDAYLDLQGDRGGDGNGPISWSKVNAYAREIGLDQDLADDLHHHIRAMDDEWRAWYTQKQETERRLGAAGKVPPARPSPKTRSRK